MTNEVNLEPVVKISEPVSSFAAKFGIASMDAVETLNRRKNNEDLLKDSCGVVYNASTGTFDVIDSTAWASEQERTMYINIKDTKGQEATKNRIIEQRYGSDNLYLNNPIENLDSYDDLSKKAFEEMTLVARATDKGYLSTLSAEERTELIDSYLEWSETHTQVVTGPSGVDMPLFGVSDKDFSCMFGKSELREGEIALAERTESLYTAWQSANMADLQIHNGVYTVESEQESSVEAETNESEQDEPEVDSNANGEEKVSAWGKITSTICIIGAAFIDTVKSIYDNKLEPWFEAHGFIQRDKDEMLAENEKEAATSESENEASAGADSKSTYDKRLAEAEAIAPEESSDSVEQELGAD